MQFHSIILTQNFATPILLDITIRQIKFNLTTNYEKSQHERNVLCVSREGSFESCNLSTACIATGWLRAGRSGNRIPVGAKFFAQVQTGPGAQPVSCTMGTGSFPGRKAARAWCWPPTPFWGRGHEWVEIYLCSPSGPLEPVIGRTLLYFYSTSGIQIIMQGFHQYSCVCQICRPLEFWHSYFAYFSFRSNLLWF
jgi:hypothetical protein